MHPRDFEELRLDFIKQGKAYSFDIPFLEQFASLYATLAQPSRLMSIGGENVEYADAVWKSRNVYLSFIVIDDCENI